MMELEVTVVFKDGVPANHGDAVSAVSKLLAEGDFDEEVKGNTLTFGAEFEKTFDNRQELSRNIKQAIISAVDDVDEITTRFINKTVETRKYKPYLKSVDEEQCPSCSKHCTRCGCTYNNFESTYRNMFRCTVCGKEWKSEESYPIDIVAVNTGVLLHMWNSNQDVVTTLGPVDFLHFTYNSHIHVGEDAHICIDNSNKLMFKGQLYESFSISPGFRNTFGIHNIPKTPMFLHLFHGRKTLTENMDDWGENGPHIGPIVGYRYYNNTITVTGVEDVSIKLSIIDGCIAFQNMYWGDWSVFLSDTASQSIPVGGIK